MMSPAFIIKAVIHSISNNFEGPIQ